MRTLQLTLLTSGEISWHVGTRRKPLHCWLGSIWSLRSFHTVLFAQTDFNASDEFLAIFAAFMLLFGFFMLPTRIHERYLFPAISVLALMFPFVKRARPLYVVLTATLLINEAYVLYWLNAYYPNAAKLDWRPSGFGGKRY